MAKKEQYIKIKDLSVSKVLYDFINKELFKGLDIEVDDFWSGFNKAIHDLAPKNKKLLDFDGKTISLNINLRASAMGWSKPK